MKFKFLILLCICCSVIFTSCDKDEPTPNPVGANRTVLVYLAADNSLSRLAWADLEEMKKGMAELTNPDVHLLAYVDTKGDLPRLIEFQNKNGQIVEKVVKEYNKRNSVGVAETKEVFTDVFSNSNYAADSYGLVYWSHGDGWIPNPLPKSRWIGQDTGDGTHFMNVEDLVTIMAGAPHFDFVLFDACFMHSIEVAYAMRNCTDYYLASPTEIPGPGARYDVLVPALFAEGNAALKIAAAYYDPYEASYDEERNNTNSNWTGGVSFGMMKSSELENLASITKQVLLANASVSTLLSTVYDYDQRHGYKEYVGYYDMVDMMKLLTDAAGYSAWKQAYDAAMPYWKTTSMNYSDVSGMFSMEGTNGVSHYIPTSTNADATAAYRSTEWYKDAGLSKLNW